MNLIKCFFDSVVSALHEVKAALLKLLPDNFLFDLEFSSMLNLPMEFLHCF